MKTRRLLFVFWTCLAITALAGCCRPSKVGSVGVSLIPQERDWWCWAACTEMVSDYYGHQVPQCQSANFVHGTPPDCCTGCTGDCPGWGAAWGASIGDIQNNWTHWDFDYEYESTSLSWSKIKTTICPNKYCGNGPIYVVWWWYPIGWSGGHVVTAYGYAEVGNDRYVYYYNPLPESCETDGTDCEPATGGEDAVSTYDAFVDDGVHKWGNSFYAFEYTGP